MDDGVWQLFNHQQEPYGLAECYVGVKYRDGDVFFEFAVWDCDVFLDSSCSRDARLFGFLDPGSLPGVYWCFASEFPSKDAARKSFQDFLSQSCDRP